jgi:hypothetical protein
VTARPVATRAHGPGFRVGAVLRPRSNRYRTPVERRGRKALKGKESGMPRVNLWRVEMVVGALALYAHPTELGLLALLLVTLRR